MYSQIFVKNRNVSDRLFRAMEETDLWKKQKLKSRIRLPLNISPTRVTPPPPSFFFPATSARISTLSPSPEQINSHPVSTYMEMRGIYIEQSIYIYSYLTINVQSKFNQAKQSEKFDAKKANGCEKNGSEYLKRTCETHAKRIFRFISLGFAMTVSFSVLQGR